MVWCKYNGLFSEAAPCYACNTETCTIKNFTAAHIIADANQGACAIQNLRPCCAHCNLSCGTQHLQLWAISKGLKGRIVSEQLPPEAVLKVPPLPLPIESPAELNSKNVEGLLFERQLLRRKLAEIDAELNRLAAL